MDILGPICKYCIVNKKINGKFRNTMCMLWGGYVAKYNLTIMVVGIA
jgi:hypothetical protein